MNFRRANACWLLLAVIALTVERGRLALALAAQLIQAHAKVVSKFVERGFREAQQNHAVPTLDSVKSKTPE